MTGRNFEKFAIIHAGYQIEENVNQNINLVFILKNSQGPKSEAEFDKIANSMWDIKLKRILTKL